MESLPFDKYYALLRSRGLTPLAATLAMCRSKQANLSLAVEWLSKNVPEQTILANRWQRYSQEQLKDSIIRIGALNEGCYLYFSLLRRPSYTVFIEWRRVQRIFLQDGMHSLAIEVCAPKKYGGQSIQAMHFTDGFAPFVEAISERYFRRDDYIMGKFKLGPHAIRKLQIWPIEREVKMLS